MPWPGAPLRLCLLLWILSNVGPPWCLAEQNVGCLFSDRLCLEEEWCYDDFAFGRCLPAAGDVDEDDFFRFDLERESLRELSSELRRLYTLGYRWSHGYTQCRLQAMLYAFRHDMDFEPDSCSHLSDNDLEGALKALEGQVPLDPREVAIIRYTPSAENPHADFADEVYYPPVQDLEEKAREELREKILGSDGTDVLDMEDPYAEYSVINKRSWIPQMHRRAVSGFPSFFDDRYGFPKRSAYSEDPQDAIDFLKKYESGLADEDVLRGNDADLEDVYTTVKYLNDMQLSPKEIEKFLSPENHRKLELLLKQFQKSESVPEGMSLPDMLKYPVVEPTDNQRVVGPERSTTNDFPDERFTMTYNTPDNFRAGWESRDSLAFPEELQDQRIYDDESEGQEETAEYGSGHPSIQYNSDGPMEPIFRERLTGNADYNTGEIFRELKQRQELDNERFDGKWRKGEGRHGIYSEGGMVPEDIRGVMQNHQKNRLLKDDLDQLFDTYSNMGFKRPERLDVKKPGPPFDDKTALPQKDQKVDDKPSSDILLPSMMKKEPRGPNPVQEPKNERSGDDQFVFVELKDGLKTWRKGHDIIMNISNLLHLEPNAFTDGQVFSKYVVFRVQNNSRGLNASDVARQIGFIRDQLRKLTGVEVVSAGLGDGKRVQTVASTPIYDDTQFYTVVFLVCGVLGGLIVAVALLIVIMRHIKSKEKLQALAKPDTEASKDYQDLCRARMAAKTQPASETVHGRITSLSRESEQSPSSRSSTSSWSEEPALHNMDISTGHMVLSYMEDHLKNKDRLEQEWVALCAYVAEPCETTIALKKENVDKNRYPEVVPYDHARVVLNELCNASNSDYINASSITDHDPRNPAYIATQGPLPHTAADFWQLIWEQGAVVIVMLTRLTESGAAMCHRYWPEEGSELYHIYEVHLVSEHIWCDDYLVRSFYLKNIKTGETRTVTQFHFLSWPEGGVPASTKALLEFRRKVNKSYRGRSCPIVVHCSDGAGRTGTYCLIDLVLGRMAKGAKEIDIAATLEHLRDQRPRMVATKQQFEFVLTAVAEEVHAILKALPPQPTPTTTTTTAPPPEKPEK